MADRGLRARRQTIPLLTLLTMLVTCTEDRNPIGPRVWRTPLGQVSTNPPVVLVGAGDIAECDDIHDEETAALLDGIAGTVFAAGDIAYDNGSDADFQNCYDPTWGRHKARTRPAPGNHEYNTPGATGYFNYFGAAAGVAGKGYYSYNLGDWHIIALNNYISMDVGQEQDNWLRADLAGTTQPCKLAYYHEPLYSSTTGSGSGGTTTNSVRPLFTTLYTGGVDVVLNGHRHFYERLAPMNPDGQLDTEQGVRQFIVGTGGASIGNPTNAFPLSEVRFGSANYGVLKLYLYSDSYAWKFIPVPGKTLSDSGSYACHGSGSGVSASQSTVVASPTSITVESGTATIAVTVRDAFGTPISGATVALTVDPAAGTTLTQPAGVTGANGVATGTLSSTELGDKTVSATATLGSVTTAIALTATVTVGPPTVITQTLLTAGTSAVNQKVYTTAGISPTPNTLVTVAVLGHNATAAPPSPTLSGGGMSAWDEVATVTFDAVGTPHKRLTVFRAMSAAPGSGALTITWSTTVSNSQWIVSQWGGVDLSGANGAGAIVQTNVNSGDAVSGLAVPLAAFGNANNVAYGVFGVSSSVLTVAPGAGFTEISEQPSAESPTADLQAEWRTNDNTIDATWAPARNGGALGVEIRAAPSGSGSGVDALRSTVSTGPTSIAAGNATSTITVTVKDASGVPIGGATVVLAATGGGNTLTQPAPPGVTDANGVATGTLSSTVAETKTVSATADGTAISQHATVTVTPGPVSAARSTVIASPTSITPGGETSTIEVTAKDAFGNPISGATVALTATPETGNILTQPSPTDAGGLAAGTLSSTVAETKTVFASANGTLIDQTATVMVTTQGATQITQTLLTAGTSAVNQKVYTTAAISPTANTLVTVAVLGHNATAAPPSPTVTGGGMAAWTEVASITFDALGTPHKRLTLYRAMSAAPGSGALTITWSATVSNSQWIVSQWGGVEATGANGAGAIVQTGSNRSDVVSGLAVPLGAFGNANNVAYGLFGVPRSVVGVTPGVGFTEISEQASGESPAADLEAEWTTNDNTIDATWPTNLNAGALGVELKAAASGSSSGVDPAQSTVSAAPTSITPGGAGSTVTVTVKEASGAPISGATVALTVTPTAGSTVTPPGPTDVNGVYEGTLTSTAAGEKIVSATATIATVTTPITQTATVTVTTTGGSTGSIAINTGDGQSDTVGTALPIPPSVVVRDEVNSPMAGVPVTFAVASGGGTVNPTTSVTTDENGIAAVTSWTLGTTAGTNTLTATSTGLAGSPVTFTATGTADAPSSIAIDAGDGQSATVGTAVAIPPSVRVADQYGNRVAQVPVTFAVASGGGTVNPPTPVTTDASGIAAVTSWTLGAAEGTNTLTATSTEVAGSSVTFTATGTPSATATITHTLLTAGNNTVNQKLFTTASIAPAPNALITLAVLGHNSTSALASPTVTGGGMSAWTEVATVTFDAVGTPHKRLTIYRAMSAGPGSGALTITWSTAVSNCQWIVSQWDGVATTGVNGADAIGQTGSNRGDAVSGLTVPLAAFGNANNVAYGVFGVTSGVLAVTPGAGFTEISEQPSVESPYSDLAAEWATNLNTIAATWAARNGAALGVEIKAGTSPP